MRHLIPAGLIAVALAAVVGEAAAQPAANEGTIYFTDWRAQSARGEIQRMRADGSGHRRVTRRKEGNDSSVSVAREGSRLVFTRITGVFRVDIFRARRDGSRVRRLTRSRRHAIGEDVAISPDGSRIAFIKREALWTMRADGSGARKLVGYPGHDYVSMPSFSPDGNQIAFNHTILTPTGPAENEELVIVGVDGAGTRVVGPRYDEVTAPRFSPDGTQIVYGCGDDDTHALCLIGSDGQQHNVFLTGTGRGFGGVSGRAGTTATWSPSGEQIAYDCRNNRICVVGRDGSGARVVGRGSMPDWR